MYLLGDLLSLCKFEGAPTFSLTSAQVYHLPWFFFHLLQMVLLERMYPLSAPQFVASPQLIKVPPLELKAPLLVGSKAPSQESTVGLCLHQIWHPTTQLSFWGMASTHGSFGKFFCNPKLLAILRPTQASSLIIWRHGSKWRLQKSCSATRRLSPW